MADKTKTETEKLAENVLKLYHNTPNGIIFDANTILRDYINNANFEITSIGFDMIEIWRHSTDKPAVEKSFELFTGQKFITWLKDCEANTSRP